PLATLADVALRPVPAPVVVRVNGEPAVTLVAAREPGRHLLAAAADLRAAARRAEAALPPGVRLLTDEDVSAPVRAALLDVAVRWAAGLLLVFALLAVMLGSIRAIGLVALALAGSVALALVVLRALGLTLNVMTLAALTLLSGLVIDAAVVVVETVLRRRRAEGAAAEAAAEVARPLAGGTLTTAVLVVPLLFLSGELRAVLLPVGVVVGVTLLAALVMAFVFVAPLAPHLPRGRLGAGGQLVAQPVLDALARAAVRFPRATLAAVVLGIGVPLWWLPPRVSPGADPEAPRALLARVYNETLGTPAAREAIRAAIPYVGGTARLFRRDVTFATDVLPPTLPEVRVRLLLPPGADAARADSLLRRFEATALADPDVRQTEARLAGREARLRVRYTEDALATGRALASRERLVFEAVQAGGLDIGVVGLDPLGYSASSGGYVSPIWIEARGPDYDRLDTLAHAFARFARARSPLVGYTSATGSAGGIAPEPVLRLLWGGDVAARTGLSAREAATAFAAATAGGHAAGTAYLPEAGLLPVRVVLPEAPVPDAALPDARAVAARPFRPPGAAAPARLAQASLALEPAPQTIDREDRQYRRFVLVEFRGPSSQAETFIDEALAAFPVPPGYRLAPRERSRFWETERRPLGLALGGAALFVLLVLAATFESWRRPLLCAAFLPPAALGAMAALARGGGLFNEGAAIGCVLLVGIAVNDGILLVDRYALLRRARPAADPRRLVRAAIRARSYPMWTTTLSTVLGLAPLLVLPASAFWQAFALAVLGGLVASTLLGPLCVAAAAALGARGRPES
ncbi:MAG: efflux RND transporter permease subunit, partial [Rubricoccaceae bacterium]